MSPNYKGTVFVTDADRGSAVSIIRSLGRQGWRVMAADSNASSLGFKSRYTAERVLYPDPEIQPGPFVDVVLDAAQAQHIDLIIPVTDATILPLSAARARFNDLCPIAMPSVAELETVNNKRKTFDLARELGVPVPRTDPVHTLDEARRIAPELSWPVVLKPQSSSLYQDQQSIESFQVSYANDVEDLAVRVGEFEGRCAVLLQEYCRGTGYGVEVLMREGRPLAAFQHKRLREIPVTGGASAFRESVPLDQDLYDYSIRLLQSLNWTGLAMVEFKTGADGPKLMEINGRVWGSLPLAVHSGIDFPAQLAELYQRDPDQDPAEPDLHYRVGVRSRNLELDIVWIVSVLLGLKRYPFLKIPGRLAAVSAFLGIFNPMYKLDVQSWTDPGPGLAEIPKIIKRLRQKLQERM